jgi:hypothetical protein
VSTTHTVNFLTRCVPYLHHVRTILITSIVVCGLLAVDLWAFQGRYRNATWVHATTQGALFQSQIQHLLRKLD